MWFRGFMVLGMEGARFEGSEGLFYGYGLGEASERKENVVDGSGFGDGWNGSGEHIK